jgi:hypothetical protein
LAQAGEPAPKGNSVLGQREISSRFLLHLIGRQPLIQLREDLRTFAGTGPARRVIQCSGPRWGRSARLTIAPCARASSAPLNAICLDIGASPLELKLTWHASASNAATLSSFTPPVKRPASSSRTGNTAGLLAQVNIQHMHELFGKRDKLPAFNRDLAYPHLARRRRMGEEGRARVQAGAARHFLLRPGRHG